MTIPDTIVPTKPDIKITISTNVMFIKFVNADDSAYMGCLMYSIIERSLTIKRMMIG